MDVFVARQPIFDAREELFAYELLFRSSMENFFSHADPDLASSRLIDSSLFVLGLDSLTSNKRAFINITRRLLVERLVAVLPKERTGLEILETVEPDEEVITACKELKELGYTLVLDDFVYSPEFEPLVSLADIIKIDFLQTTGKERKSCVERFAPRNIRLLAEKVETREEFNEAVGLGYSYFQGFFFCKPEIITGKDIPGYKLNYLRFMQEINSPDVDFDRLERVIKGEVSLSVKLLRYLNSAAIGLRCRVTSIKQALVMLGERPLKKWAMLVAMTGLGDDKPAELVLTCLIRARFCELTGKNGQLADRDFDLFLVGLLSAVNALMDRPMDHALDEMSLPPDVRETLLGGDTPLGAVYSLVLAYEQGNWDTVAGLADSLGMAEEGIPGIYASSVQWADQFFAA